MPPNALDLLVVRCHALAERVTEFSPPVLLQELRGIVASASLATTLHEQLLARSLVTNLLGRLARIAKLDSDPEIARAFIALAASTWAGDEWYQMFASAAGCFEKALTCQNDLGPGRPTIDVRMHRAIRFIDAHYYDSHLTLRRVADHAGLSLFYAARMLKCHTGDGFVVLLRQRRIAAAQKLLDSTVLSIKEIAAKVGYGTPRQFERDFKRLCGVSPTTVRMTTKAAKSDGK